MKPQFSSSGWWRRWLRRPALWCVVALSAAGPAFGLALDDLQFWAGTGTNRAALVIHWSAPEVRNHTSVPGPIAEKSLAWGYRWNGSANAEDLFNAILAADQQLFAAVSDVTPYGKTVFALGYDLNNNHRFGLRNGTNLLVAAALTNAPSAFTNGLAGLGHEAADVLQALEGADLYWGGWSGANWELWHESGQQGGFDHAPDRGPNPYWTPDDPDLPFSGHQGEWEYAQVGLSGLTLRDGAWIGWSVAAGGLDFGDPENPGTSAWGLHKHAPASPAAAPTNISPYAVEVVTAQAPFGSSPYDDPLAVLGEPASLVVNFDPIIGSAPYHVKLVEPAYNRDVDGRKTLVTLRRSLVEGEYAYGAVTIKFDHPVHDDPANPYGVDFQVFGNTFYVGSGYVGDASDMRTYNLVGGAFGEPMLVSVSPDGVNWYTYTNGPFCDTPFPTHGYEWDAAQHDATGNGWTAARMDFTKPVNPALNEVLGAPEVTLSAADAIQLYAGSGGGTGFDLAETGFESIQYLRVEAAAGYYAGEVDAISDVRPMMLGESLTVTPDNLTTGTATLFFQDPGNVANHAVQIHFHDVNQIALVTATPFQDSAALAALPNRLVESAAVTVAPMLGENPLKYVADLALHIGSRYAADGSDLDAYAWDGTNWTRLAFTYDPAARTVTLESVTRSIAFAVVQITAPALTINRDENGFAFTFTPMVGWTHTLERTTDFSTWSPLDTVTPDTAASITLRDDVPPADQAFYRLKLGRP